MFVLIPNNPIRRNMNYPCHVCDKTIKFKSKIKICKSLSHTELDKCIRLKHTFENPDFFDIDETFIEYITH